MPDKLLKPILIIVLIIAAYLLIGLFLYLMIMSPPGNDLTRFISYYTVIILELTFILLIIALVFNFKYIKELCKEIGKKYILLLIFIAIAGVLTTSFVAPRIHRIYYDEDIYNHIGQCIANNRQAVMCNEGHYENNELKIIQWEYNKQPHGFPFLSGIIFRIFGTNELFVFILNNILFGLTIIVIFFITFLLFKDTFASILASLAFLFIPINLQWYNTSAVEPSTTFFLCLSVLALLIYLKNKKPINLFFLTCSLAFSFYFRMESILIVFVIGLFLLLKDIKTFQEKYIYLFGILLFFLSTGFLFHLFLVRGQNWGALSGPKLGFDIFLYNLGTNSIFYFNNKIFPLMFSLFAIVGLIFYKTKTHLKEKLSVFIWFLVFWGIFLFFYAGSYQYGQDVRFSLLSYAPIAIFAGLGVSFSGNLLKDKIKPIKPILVILLVLNFSWFLPFIRAEGEEAWAARRDHRYADEFAQLMGDNSIIYTHNPNIFLLREKSAIQSSFGMHFPGIIEQHLAQFKGGVYIHFNFWSNVDDPAQRGYTEYLLNNYNYEIIKEYYYRNYKYGLYKIINHR
ncbi:MAG: glycosyltransferase family 39 protein [Spirochaetales bacterium]|nr:glycosyltransferase family 39 protein [Spirochaetales bacterium]